MLVSEFDYELPPRLIAQHPAAQRTASRLLRVHSNGTVEDLVFEELAALVGSDDALVLNDTRVINARLHARKRTGGRVEMLVERVVSECEVLALVRASHPPVPGSDLLMGSDLVVKVEERRGELFRLRFPGAVLPLLDRYGTVPLPPYISHPAKEEDAERYQTVYACAPGAVAAPTAGLHFDAALLRAIEARGARIAKLTLHVGAGTFQPVRVDRVEAHRMHAERYSIPASTIEALRDRRVMAVGTTSLRALEAAARTGRREGETDLFIYPGFEFRVVKRLLTNFHLPRSTLLMLACAFGGKERILSAYRHAVSHGYRFFSYGDAMLIET